MKTTKSVEDYFFTGTDEVPNNPLLPLLIYREAFQKSKGLAKEMEMVFQRNDWQPAWRFGIYDYPHYHSTAHEVIGVFQGRARVSFGHTGGITTWLEPGDVVVIPAGVGHQSLETTRDFCAVGGYPVGQKPDIVRAKAGQDPATKEQIDCVLLPETDPIHGAKGPLMDLW